MAKEPFKRFSITMPESLCDEFSIMIEQQGQQNRSLAIAKLARNAVLQHHQLDPLRVMAGTIMLTYFETNNSAATRLIAIRRERMAEVISTQQVILEEGKLLEIWLVQGETQVLQELLMKALRCSDEMTGELNFTDALMPPVRHNSYNVVQKT